MKENLIKVETWGSPDKKGIGKIDDFSESIKLTENRNELTPLSEKTKEVLKDSGYSEKIIEAIGSEEEVKIYQDANVEPKTINGKDVLVKRDIDYEQKDGFDRTNLERMEKGLAPLDKNGKLIELHHIGQKNDSSLIELSPEEHRGKGNDTILHNKQKESEINREQFAQERSEHWKARAAEIREQGA